MVSLCNEVLFRGGPEQSQWKSRETLQLTWLGKEQFFNIKEKLRVNTPPALSAELLFVFFQLFSVQISWK